MKENIQGPVIVCEDWYEVALYNFVYGNKETYQKYYDALTIPRYRVSDTEENYRTINYWDEQGLLIGKREKVDSWRKFSIFDLVWIRILKRLKKYGVEGEKVLQLKKSLLSLKDTKGRYTDFAFWIFMATRRNDVFLVVLPDGRGSIAIKSDIELNLAVRKYTESFITIDFPDVVRDLVRPQSKGEKKTELNRKLDDKEIELLNTLSNVNIESVTAHLKKGKIDRIEWKSIEQNPERLFELLRKKIDESPNQTITLKRQDGKVLFIEQKKSQKLP
jgi:DNA-binding transcriptional MerR regulator